MFPLAEPGFRRLELDMFRRDLDALYQELDGAVASKGPVCQLSGRCCRFAQYGHTLFLSAPEAALLIELGPPPARPLDEGETCPWQDQRGHCTARAVRPLGCRVYYCDEAFDGHAEDLSEHYLARLKRLADRHGLPWNYAPLHAHLRAARDAGQFPPRPPAAAPQDDPA